MHYLIVANPWQGSRIYPPKYLSSGTRRGLRQCDGERSTSAIAWDSSFDEPAPPNLNSASELLPWGCHDLQVEFGLGIDSYGWLHKHLLLLNNKLWHWHLSESLGLLQLHVSWVHTNSIRALSAKQAQNSKGSGTINYYTDSWLNCKSFTLSIFLTRTQKT